MASPDWHFGYKPCQVVHHFKLRVKAAAELLRDIAQNEKLFFLKTWPIDI